MTMTIDDQLRAALERERAASAQIETLNQQLYQAQQEVNRLAALQRAAWAAYQEALRDRKAIEEERQTSRLYARGGTPR